MPNEPSHRESPKVCSGWNLPRPRTLSQPTVWPATLALGVALLLWGVVTSWLVSVVGLALFAIALAGWIGNMRHERKR